MKEVQKSTPNAQSPAASMSFPLSCLLLVLQDYASTVVIDAMKLNIVYTASNADRTPISVPRLPLYICYPVRFYPDTPQHKFRALNALSKF